MKNVLIILLIITICVLSVFIGYNGYNPFSYNDEIKEAGYKNSQNLVVQDDREQADKPVVATSSNMINKYTKMVYEYVYLYDDITEVVEDVPPYFLLNLTREDLEKNFSDWQVLAFSDNEVIMQKLIEAESPQHYSIKDYDGFVAVFYSNLEEGEILKDITDIPLESLPEYERVKIENGLEIVGKDKLISFLQDYGS